MPGYVSLAVVCSTCLIVSKFVDIGIKASASNLHSLNNVFEQKCAHCRVHVRHASVISFPAEFNFVVLSIVATSGMETTSTASTAKVSTCV